MYVESERALAPCVPSNRLILQKYILVVMLHLAITNSFHLRQVLEVVVEEMFEFEQVQFHEVCPEDPHKGREKVETDFVWSLWLHRASENTFYTFYGVAQMPLGWLADELGARYVLSTGILISAIVTMLLPLSIRSGNEKAIISLRAIFGLAQATLYPSVSSVLQQWIPRSERTFLGGLSLGGSGLGIFLVYTFTGPIMRYFDNWSSPFYIWGLVAIGWYLLSLCMLFSKPSCHPFIGQEELTYLRHAIEKERKIPTPWLRIVTSTPVWALLLLSFGRSYMTFTLLENFPQYMHNMLKLNIKDHAAFSALPYLVLWSMNMPLSWGASFVVRREWCTLLTLKKTYGFAGNFVTAMFLLVAVHMGCHRNAAVVVYCVAFAFKAALINSILLNPNDLTHHFAGTVMGFTNGMTASTGILGPIVHENLTKSGDIEDWQMVFGIIFALSTLTAGFFLFLADAKRQEWDFSTTATPRQSRQSIQSLRRR